MAQLQAGPATFPTRGKPCVWEPRGSERPVFIAERGREYWLMTTGDYTTYTYKSIYIYTPAITSTSTYFYFYFFLVQRAVLATGCYQRAKIFTTDRGRTSFAGGNCGEQISLYAIHIFICRYWDILGWLKVIIGIYWGLLGPWGISWSVGILSQALEWNDLLGLWTLLK
jgi:hypothetical protein